MKIQIYTLASDTEEGLSCELFTSQRKMYERVIALHNMDQEDTLEAQRLLALEMGDIPPEEIDPSPDLLDFLSEHRNTPLDSFSLSSEIIETTDFPEFIEEA
jgi:hypothetical protein